jgi:hypothetical protein
VPDLTPVVPVVPVVPAGGLDTATLLGVAVGAVLLAVVALAAALYAPWLLLLFVPHLLGSATVALYYGLPPLWAWMWR